MAKKSSNKILFILLGVVLVLVIGLVVAKQAGIVGGEKATKVETAVVGPRKIVEKVSASGAIQPETEVKISPDVSGEIIELEVKEGEMVKEGQFLIRIRPDLYQSALSRAEATLNQQIANMADARARLARAEASFKRSELDFNRNSKLYEEKVISAADFEQIEMNFNVAKQDFESAKQAVESSRFLVQSAQASVREAKENLRFTTIYAPMSGTVSKLNVEKGERVVGTSQMAGTEMLRIADLAQMEVRVNVNENDIIRISIGDTAIIDVDSYTYMNKKFKGIVSAIANTAKDKINAEAVTEFEVKIRVLNDSYKDIQIEKNITNPFRPGMTASVDVITNSKEDILAVPLASVTTRTPKELEKAKSTAKEGEEEEVKAAPLSSSSVEDDKPVEVVFVVVDGKVEVRKVKTGISDFENIEILDGLKAGEVVVKGPYQLVSKKMKHGDLVEAENKSAEGRTASK